MIKHLTEAEYEDFKKTIRKGANQGKMHYSIAVAMLDREDETKQNLLDHINHLQATCKTQENMLDHYKRVIRTWLNNKEISEMIEKEFNEIDDLFNLLQNAN